VSCCLCAFPVVGGVVDGVVDGVAFCTQKPAPNLYLFFAPVYPRRSRPQASVPNQESDDLLYDIKYYSRDVRRQPSTVYVATNQERATMLDLPTSLPESIGSPGNNNPDLNKLGASHLRSAMSTNHADYQAELVNYKQTHCPTFVWEKGSSFIDVNAKAGLPPTLGAPMEWNLPFTPDQHPGAKW
jgi:hypothetical protein